MSKLLVSWLAFNNDFTRENPPEFVQDGPTARLYKHHLNDYDKHYVLLAWEDTPQDRRQLARESSFRKFIQRKGLSDKVKLIHLSIPDNDIINPTVIKQKVEPFISGLFGAQQIDVFISPGTPAMQVVWYLLGPQYGLSLFQTVKPKHPDEPVQKIPVTIELSDANRALHLKTYNDASTLTDDDYLINTPTLTSLYEQATLVANTDRIAVLITGESGTGKEHLANTIHNRSIRKEKNFVTVNCSAFRDDLLESRLFGYKKGAFTGAEKDTPGLFEEANGGTIFLDEIGDISPYMQQTLLRVIQEGEILPVGSNSSKKVDVRVVAATHRDLQQMCADGKFRWDLYYRLAVVNLYLTPLRERGSTEVAMLLDHLLRRRRVFLQKSALLTLSKEAEDHLLSYTYPGNVREMVNIIDSLYVFKADSKKVALSDLPKRILTAVSPQSWNLEAVKKQHIQKALSYFDNNITHTAKALGVTRNTVDKYKA